MNNPTSPTASPGVPDQPGKSFPRLDSVDLLRGIVMVIMALDHTRDYFSNVMFDPTDLSKTNAVLFLTRWITHFCAPVFFFLAGTGAFLSTLRGKTRGELARFLVTRGLWLVFLELTFIRWFGWDFNLDIHNFGLLVIWALGWSMVALAGLIYLPRRALIAFGLIMVVGHNLLDKITPEKFGKLRWLWIVLHTPDGFEPMKGINAFVMYPLIPWIGVMALGYCLGTHLLKEPPQRQKFLLRLGAIVTLAFIALRAVNVYGDASKWSFQPNRWYTILSFLNCTKYPPSLLYLLMTLGPALMALALLDRTSGSWRKPFLAVGRVPMFYYLLHLPLIHLLAIIFSWIRYGRPAAILYGNPPHADPPPGFGYNLLVVYLVWIGVVAMLYPVCSWFAAVKKRRKDVWLSYF